MTSSDIPYWKKALEAGWRIVLDDLEKLVRPLRLLPLTPPAKLKNREGFHVLITGGYGYGNVGDEAQLNANILRWRKKNPDARLTIFSPHPEYSEKEHREHAENAPRVVWFNSNNLAYYWAANFIFSVKFYLLAGRQLAAARLMRAGLPPLLISAEEAHLLHLVQRATILHISGGGFLTGMTRSRLWENALLLRLAHMLGTPSILTGQTIGVFKSRTDRIIARWGLRHSKTIYLRDKDGSELDLRGIGIAGSHVQSLYDDALFCSKAPEEICNEQVIQAGLNPDQPFIAVNYHYWGMSPEMVDQATSRFAELCNHVAQRNGQQLLLLPMTPSDESALDHLKTKLTVPAGMLSYGYDFRIARGVIAKADWVFTMKHHPIIFAQGEGVPVASVCLDSYYFRKNKGAMANFGHEQYCLDKDLFFAPEAEAALADFVQKLPSLREALTSQLAVFRTKEECMLDGADRYLPDQDASRFETR